jgi:hypothetical protein
MISLMSTVSTGAMPKPFAMGSSSMVLKPVMMFESAVVLSEFVMLMEFMSRITIIVATVRVAIIVIIVIRRLIVASISAVASTPRQQQHEKPDHQKN